MLFYPGNGLRKLCKTLDYSLHKGDASADTRTQAQRYALLDLLTILKHQYPEAQILGHYQLSATIHKACPCYDARKEYLNL